MDDNSVLEQLFDQKILKLLQVFFSDEEKEFYLREIAQKAGVAPASTFRIINKLVKLNVLELVTVSKFKLYKIKKNKAAEELKKLLSKDKRILDLFVEKVRELPEVRQIILHGKEGKDKANVLLIGEGIDSTFVKSLTYNIKERYKFSISSLTLAEDQYEQMSLMGLYSGEKKTLFLRR
ncbi:hypothetical protein GOV08_01585 [Candidatus Woesearchaeota archaeon]|nr:hypothetical protein [Candidatus Woesearchaeota archaeon]